MRSIDWSYFFGLLLIFSLAACSGGGGGSDGNDGEDETDSEIPEPFLIKPFDNNFTLFNFFDHDLPLQFVDVNGYMVDYEGVQRNIGTAGAGIDGHEGYDWNLPTGTDLKAVAAGEVILAGETMFHCPALPGSPLVTQKDVSIQHLASNGEIYSSVYSHLDTIAVSVGDIVNTGDILGTSGNSGCSTGPHLHFGIYWWSIARKEWIAVDPYGWTAAYPDPWAQYPDGTESVTLWKAGQAPTLMLQ